MNHDDAAARALLLRFDRGLADQRIEMELCVVGGAVITLNFARAPRTRRPRALFASSGAALAARRHAAERAGVALDRLEEAARTVVTGQAAAFEGERLRVFSPPPDYVLAMKCAALRFVPEGGVEDDIRYLLRFLGVRDPAAAVDVVSGYLTPRQRPEDLESRLASLIS
ncbi:MAG: hypothetical protein HKN72_04645 [Gemmatimonadetes bacterium]|nr:hypothetical protein [Gemmatimonadota bacterium]NNF12483.1 hypothetical protein [Gemmatimonadota bacterium]NNL29514.1 hypothetical protein [Gemmatimonadota bacterium]